MGIGNWNKRLDQWSEHGSFSGSGLDIVYTSQNYEKQRMNVFAESEGDNIPKDVKVPEEAAKLERTVLMNRKDADGQQRGGWMYKSSDWRNYEVTAIQFIPKHPDGFEDDDPEDTCAWYGRGAKHTGSSVDKGSQGSAIKPDLRYAGNKGGWQVLKETIHFDPFKSSNDETLRGTGDDNILESHNFGNIKGKWFGFKTVIYNEDKKHLKEILIGPL